MFELLVGVWAMQGRRGRGGVEPGVGGGSLVLARPTVRRLRPAALGPGLGPPCDERCAAALCCVPAGCGTSMSLWPRAALTTSLLLPPLYNRLDVRCAASVFRAGVRSSISREHM